MLCTYNSRLVTVVLRKFFKIIAKKLVFNPFSNNSTFQEPLVCMLRYKFREAADLQGGVTDLQGRANAPPPPPPPPPKCGPGYVQILDIKQNGGSLRGTIIFRFVLRPNVSRLLEIVKTASAIYVLCFKSNKS